MIEVIQYRQSDAGLRTVFLCAVLVACLITGVSLAYFTAEDEAERFVQIERIELSLTENWNAEDGLNYQAGLIATKQPVFTAEKGDMYTRMRVTIEEYVEDAQGNVTTRPLPQGQRLDLIKGIIWADEAGVIAAGPYDKAWLQTQAAAGKINNLYDSRSFINPSQPDPTKGVFYVEYDGILSHGATTSLFTNVVIPSDYTQDEIQLMGDFVITIDGQGIQAQGFANQADAMAALDAQNAG